MSNETVLLVEDESDVRATIRDILYWYGYTVLEAASNADAKFMIQHNLRRIHLVISDLLLPDGSGMELCEHLIALYPEMKVIYITGDSASGDFSQDQCVLEKPFQLEHLLKLVSETLGDQL